MEEKIPKIRPLLKLLNVGCSVIFPIERMKSVRAQASELGAIFDRKYKTCIDRYERILIVTRVK